MLPSVTRRPRGLQDANRGTHCAIRTAKHQRQPLKVAIVLDQDLFRRLLSADTSGDALLGTPESRARHVGHEGGAVRVQSPHRARERAMRHGQHGHAAPLPQAHGTHGPVVAAQRERRDLFKACWVLRERGQRAQRCVAARAIVGLKAVESEVN